MPFYGKNTAGPGRGLWPASESVTAVNRTASTTFDVGAIVMFDTLASVAEVDATATASFAPGDDTIYDTIIVPTTAGLAGDTRQVFGVVTEPGGIAADTEGSVVIYGLVDAFCLSAGTLTQWDPMVPINASDTLDGVPATGELVVAYYSDVEDASIATKELKRVFFNGFGWFARELT